VEIQVGDITSKVIKPRSHLHVLAAIRDVCKARPSGFQFMPKYKSGRWDGYISLMHSMSTFPTGLLTLVEPVLQEKNIEYELLRQSRPDYQDIAANCLNGITLRDYQLGAVSKMLEVGRGVAKMATNSGKTEVMAALIKALRSPPTIIIVHRQELMYQTAQRLEDRLGMDVGIIGDGKHIHSSNVVVAMVQTLYNMLNSMPKKKVKDYMIFPDNVMMIVDECHHVSSDTMLDVINHIPGSYRYGLSGTPLKYDLLSDMKLIAGTGEIMVEVSNEYMIKTGWSAKPTIHMHIIEDTNDALWGMEYADAYAELIVRNERRNEIIIDRAIQAEGVVLILVNHIEHGKSLNVAPGSIFVQGSDSTHYRQTILRGMRESTKGIFIASPIFDEGIDVPAVDTVILAGGGKAHTKILQRIGRGLRQKEGRNELIVIDFIDDTNKYLLKHSQERIEMYGQEGFEVQVQS
jgi:superfamily II DNA or RNA helicase